LDTLRLHGTLIRFDFRRDRGNMRAKALIAAAALLALIEHVHAHGIAGNRFFPGTMAFDDPAVADEFLILPSTLNHPIDSGSPFSVFDASFSWSFARLLTPDVSIGVNGGWIRRTGDGFPTQSGFDQTSFTLKRLMYKNEIHETLISASLSWGVGGSGSQAVGANKADTVLPSVTFGKGLGDLPDQLAWLRPFALAGAVSLELPLRPTSANFGFDPASGRFGPLLDQNVEILHWGFAVEYSTLYLSDRFKPGQLPKDEPLHQLIPLVEFAFDSPRGQKAAATMNPGFAYVEDVWQVSAEVIVPLNSQGGHGLGTRAQLLLFLDDLAPSLFGKPLLSR
jgi:hypothetical protein